MDITWSWCTCRRLIQKVLDVFDLEGNGYLDLTELKNFISDILDITTTEWEVERIMDEVDTDRDGQLNYMEFFGMMNYKPHFIDALEHYNVIFIYVYVSKCSIS